MAGRGPTSECPAPPELGAYLRGVEYPASRSALIARAEALDAPQDVRQALEALEPGDFDSQAAVEHAVERLSR